MAEGKIEQALAQTPTISKRESFPRPGQWASEILRMTLNRWEDDHRFLYTTALVANIPGNVSKAELGEFRKWRNFRKIVLEQGHPDSKEWNYDAFAAKPEIVEKALKHVREGLAKNPEFKRLNELLSETSRDLNALGVSQKDVYAPYAQDYIFAPCFLEWTKASRKIYAPNSKAIENFKGMRFEGVEWEKILPFSAFLIELPEAIPVNLQIELGDFSKDGYMHSIMVVNMEMDGEKKIWCVPITTKDKDQAREFLSDKMRSICDEAGKSMKMLKRANDMRMQLVSKLGAAGYLSTYPFPMPPFNLNTPVVEEGLDETVQMVRKIVAGTCLRLAYGRVSEGKEAAGIEQATNPVSGSVITDPNEVTLVKGFDELEGDVQVSEQKLIAAVKESAFTPRHRRAHFRRPPGSAPDAEKTVYVKKSFMGRLEPGELPKGSTTKIK